MSEGAVQLEPLMDATAVGQVIGVTSRTIRRWAEMGEFPSPVIDRPKCIRWHPGDVKRWIDRKRDK